MVKIYLFIELLGSATAPKVIAALKALKLEACTFANVVALSDDKIVAQLDCEDASDGTRAILENISGVEGVVQTNVIAVVRPVQR
jgi:hypothetical protein